MKTNQTCPMAYREWVNPKSVNIDKPYKEGDFPRIWCIHEGEACSAAYGFQLCQIYRDHLEE
jgi:hypothetical protein